MKTLKRYYAAILFVCMMASISVPVMALDDQSDMSCDYAEYIGTGIISLEPVVTTRASSVITFSDLGILRGAYSESTYYIHSGDDRLVVESLSWSPSGQDISVAFVNVQDSSTYAVGYSGGTASNKTISTRNVPDGEYYVVVINYDGPNAVTGSLTYKWD